MIFVMSGGTGGGDTFAVISVTYPAGSACTCSNGSKTLRAKDTSGSYLFLIPESGTWTVTATYGSKIASKTVNITTQYQVAIVSLLYSLILYENGALGEGASIKYNGNASFVVETGAFGGTASNPTNTQLSLLPIIKPSQFKTLFITLSYNNTSATYKPGIGVLTSANANGYVAITKWDWPAISRLDTGKHEDITASVDLSSITEEFYVYFQCAYTTGTINKLWLE